MTEPLVSVIIPAYNSGKYIKRCLDSIIAQIYQNWEALVVLAPSTDDTDTKVSEYTDPRITLIRESKKSSVAEARNAGFRHSKGSYIIFLDSDDWIEPMRLESQVGFLEVYRSADWCWGYVRRVSPDGTSEINTVDPSIPRGSMVGTLSLTFRRSLLVILRHRDGYIFDSRLPFFDDVDLFFRVRDHTHCGVPAVVTNYLLNPSGMTQTTQPFRRETTMFKILIHNHAWGYIGREVRESAAVFLNWILKTDIVKKRKESRIDA